jgi:hypothetical protein
MTATTARTFPLKRPHQLSELAEEQRWLIDGLWSHEAVGVIGGEPKCCKSFLALDMALAVASGSDCLSRYRVGCTGTAMVYAAEDAEHIVRERLQWACAHRGLGFDSLDLWVIAAPRVRLDNKAHRRLLSQTVAATRPAFLVLDPFVRLHAVDENLSAAVAPLLAFLRNLQRRHHCAIALVHHARKGGSAIRAGQALRGSSELHAWGDSNLYVRRRKEQLWLTAEHRARPPLNAIPLELMGNDDRQVLVAGETSAHGEQPEAAPRRDERERILYALRGFQTPVRIRELRAACGIRSSTLSRVLGELCASGSVTRSDCGWHLSDRIPVRDSASP